MLRRHWQSLLLSVLLLLPAMPVFAQTQMLGAPVLEALAPSHSVEWRFAWVHLLEAVGVVWVLAQRTAIVGGPFAGFLASLPIPDGRRRVVDAIVVVVASTPLFLPVLAAAVALAFLPHKAVNYLFVLDLFFVTLGWQLTALSRSTRNAIALTVANGCVVGGLQADGPIRAMALAMPLLLAAYALAHTVPASASRPPARCAFSRLVPGSVRRAGRRHRLAPMAGLQIGIVRERAAAIAGRCVTMGSATASTCFLLSIWDFDARAVPLTLISQGAIALIASTTYRDLRAAHLRASPFMRSLPMTAAANVRADWLTVVALALPFASIAPLLLVVHHVVSVWAAAALLCASALLVALLYLPQRHAPRQSPLLGILLTAGWVAIAWPIFV